MKKYLVVKEIVTYSLEEMLSDPEKKKKLIEANQPTESFELMEMEIAEEDNLNWLEQIGFENPKLYWDISCSQGSGASFTFDNVNIGKLIEVYPDKELTSNLDGARDDGFRSTLLFLEVNAYPSLRIYGQQNHLSNHYTHSKTVDIYYEIPDDIDERSGEPWLPVHIVNEVLEVNEFRKYVESLVEIVKKIYEDATYRIYRNLQTSYEEMHEEKYIIGELKENEEDEFLENGQIFYRENKCSYEEVKEES